MAIDEPVGQPIEEQRRLFVRGEAHDLVAGQASNFAQQLASDLMHPPQTARDVVRTLSVSAPQFAQTAFASDLL